MNARTDTERHIGLFGATGVGVGAIVGGGILALAGVAFATTGPAAIVAFGLNGMVALLTALSFAEMASKFPESGGTYTFSKKVLSVEAAFTVGWVVWFASIVAAVLYAIGFGYFAMVLAGDVWRAAHGDAPQWLTSSGLVKAVAVATTVGLTIGLMRKAAGGGQWVNVGKVVVFAVLILGGLWAVVRQPAVDTRAALQPFFTAGLGGLIQAMGYTFIALQGFDLIAAVGGEVREPSKTLPRAMILSLALALGIYLPLLFIVATVGPSEGQTIGAAAAKDPEGIMAIAAQSYLGPFGYWLVIVAAVLSMFSALQANLFAASRIARAMACDRTLPSPLSVLHAKRGTPVVAVAVTAVVVSGVLLVLPDVGAAGAASSLIFLLTFALAHWVAILVRQRSNQRPPPFRVPLFPVVPVVGGLACIALAVFQGIVVPSAGIITVIWLSVGGVLFLGLFARRARVMDVSSTAFDPELVTLRGRTPLVLVPIANPQNVEAMITLADALVPTDIGRVLTQTVVVAPQGWQPDDNLTPIENSQIVVRELMRASAHAGIRVDMLMTVAPQPMQEIARVARLHRCESVLLGLSEISEVNHGTQLESLLGTLDVNVVVLRARKAWRLADARKILVPVAGRGGHEHLRALLLGSLLRNTRREVTFLRVLPTSARPDEVRRATRDLHRLADDEVRQPCRVEVLRRDDALEVIAEYADESDLLILGVQRHGRRKKLFGDFTRQIAQRTSCSIIVMSRRG
jgi:amino acid transporter/nucleotide-binding universal stress UspA family protein